MKITKTPPVITTQTIIIDGYKISLNFLSENNTKIGANIRAALLKNFSANTDIRLDNR